MAFPHFTDLNRLRSSMNALPHKCPFWNEEPEKEEEQEVVRKMIFIITTTKFSNLTDYLSSPDCSNIGHYALSSAHLNVSCKRIELPVKSNQYDPNRRNQRLLPVEAESQGG